MSPPMDMMSMTETMGAMAGKSTCSTRWKREAPSMVAASCCAVSTPESAARYTMELHPKSCQLLERMYMGRNAPDSRKKEYRSPPALSMMLFTSP